MTKGFSRLAALIVAAAAVATPCQAQDDAGDVGPQFQAVPPVVHVAPPASNSSVWAERFRSLEAGAERALEALYGRGIYPAVGSIVSGSGLAAGGRLRVPSFGGSRIGAEIGAMWSVRGYREYHARLGVVGDAQDALVLQGADGNFTSLFNDHTRKTPGTSAVFVEGVQRRFPAVDFYGLGGFDSPKTDFAASAASLEVVGQWQPTAEAGFVGRAGVIDFSLGRGTNDGVPNLETRYDSLLAPGLDRQEPWLAVGMGGAYDTRDADDLPVQGFFIGGVIWHLESLEGTPQAITRGVVDVRFFEPLISRSGVAAIRLLASADYIQAGGATPFYLQYWLGGSHTLRGYSSYRLRGETLVHASAEYRWRVAPMLELVPFVDVGAAARDFDELLRSTIHVTPGAGLWVRDDERFFARIDWAYGREGHRFLFSLSPSF